MLRTSIVIVAALILCGFVVMTQLPSEQNPSPPSTTEQKPPAVQTPEYWLGILCSPVSAIAHADTANLPEKQGLYVQSVAPNSPASTAGILEHDVLLTVGGAALVEPRDLIQAVESSKGQTLKIELSRDGKRQTVDVTPAKRPPEARQLDPVVPTADDWEAMRKWIDAMQSGGAFGMKKMPPHLEFRRLHPGAIVPHDVLISVPLPPGMSIVVSKEGDRPAQIVVKRGNEKWEVTEKELEKLPADVRPHVERLLGRGLVGIVGGFGGIGAGPEVFMPGKDGGIQVPPKLDIDPFERIEKRFEAMDRRMDAMLKAIEGLHEKSAPASPPEESSNERK